MKVEIVKGEALKEVSEFSKSIGNIPLLEATSMASVLRDDDGDIVGFAAVQAACHACGSYVKPEFRRKGLTYTLRQALESELRSQGIPMYFALPHNKFERELFKKYGPVKEQIVQVREL
jgi:GNAT superfamily N-acetyltransferase